MDKTILLVDTFENILNEPKELSNISSKGHSRGHKQNSPKYLYNEENNETVLMPERVRLVIPVERLDSDLVSYKF